MREVRDAMDVAAAEQRRSSRIEVSAVVLGAGGANLANGMDLKAWVEAGLVDTLIPYSSGPTLSSAEKSWTNIRDIDYFVSLTDGTPCKLAPNILPRVQNPESFWETAARLYAADVEYLFFWDCDPRFRAQYGPHWNALRGLSHRDGIPGLATHSKPLRKLGDWDLSYDTPG